MVSVSFSVSVSLSLSLSLSASLLVLPFTHSLSLHSLSHSDRRTCAQEGNPALLKMVQGPLYGRSVDERAEESVNRAEVEVSVRQALPCMGRTACIASSPARYGLYRLRSITSLQCHALVVHWWWNSARPSATSIQGYHQVSELPIDL